MAKKISVDEILAQERQRSRSRELASDKRALEEQVSGLEASLRRVTNAGKRAAAGAYKAGMTTGGITTALAGFAVFAVEWILSRFLPDAYAAWGKWIVLAISTVLVAGGYLLAMPILIWAGVVSGLLTGILWTLGKAGIIPKHMTIQGPTEIGAVSDNPSAEAEEYLEMDEMDFMEIGAAAADDVMEAETAGKKVEQRDIEDFFAGVDEWVRNGMSPIGLAPLAAKGIVIFGPRVGDLLKALRNKLRNKKRGRAAMNRKPSEILRSAMAVREVQNRQSRPPLPAPSQAALPAPAPAMAPEEIRRMVEAAVAEKRAEWEKELETIRARHERREERREARQDARQASKEDTDTSEMETYGVDEIDGVEGLDYDTITVEGVPRRRPRPGRPIVRRSRAADAFRAAAKENIQAANSSSTAEQASTDPFQVEDPFEAEDPSKMFTAGMTAEQAIMAALK